MYVCMYVWYVCMYMYDMYVCLLYNVVGVVHMNIVHVNNHVLYCTVSNKSIHPSHLHLHLNT